jgi:hypothetical protein
MRWSSSLMERKGGGKALASATSMIMAALLVAKKEASMCSRAFLQTSSAIYPTSSQAFFFHFFDSILQNTRRSFFMHAWHGKCNARTGKISIVDNHGEQYGMYYVILRKLMPSSRKGPINQTARLRRSSVHTSADVLPTRAPYHHHQLHRGG